MRQQAQLQQQMQIAQQRQMIANSGGLLAQRFAQGLAGNIEEYTNGELVAKGPMISKPVANRLANNNTIQNALANFALNQYDKNLRQSGLRPTDLESFKKPGASEYTTVKVDTLRRFANAADRAAAAWYKGATSASKPAPKPTDDSSQVAKDIRA